MKILLDTNAYTALFRGQQSAFDAVMQANEVYLSSIVIGELHAGFKGGSRIEQNEASLAKFLLTPHVQAVPVSEYTATIYGNVKHQLRQSGTPIPLNDVWIAAHAIEMGSTLITADRHFEHVAGLRIQQP